jgi:hypothetical protein
MMSEREHDPKPTTYFTRAIADAELEARGKGRFTAQQRA